MLGTFVYIPADQPEFSFFGFYGSKTFFPTRGSYTDPVIANVFEKVTVSIS
jgi:hypothetical protein